MQSKKRSLIETVTLTAMGIAYAIPLNYVMLQVKWPDLWTQSVVMVIVFTIMSIIVKYSGRRFFNWLDIKYPTAHSSTLDLTAQSSDFGTVTAGIITSPNGNFAIDFGTGMITITGNDDDEGPLPHDHPDDPVDDWGGDLWDCNPYLEERW